MLPLSISARASCRLLGKLWPLPRIRREASTWNPSSFDPRDTSAPTTLIAHHRVIAIPNLNRYSPRSNRCASPLLPSCPRSQAILPLFSPCPRNSTATFQASCAQRPRLRDRALKKGSGKASAPCTPTSQQHAARHPRVAGVGSLRARHAGAALGAAVRRRHSKRLPRGRLQGCRARCPRRRIEASPASSSAAAVGSSLARVVAPGSAV